MHCVRFVDQFLVGFNEAFTVHREKVKELRKLRMRVFTLMPLLIRTNNVISEYLIKYPQANMKKYLAYILENRYEEKNKFKWIWENDGFFSCSNYYYISALGEFYNYYETYESKYIGNYTENETNRASIQREYLKELEAPGGKIADLKRELKDKEDIVSDLQKQLNNVETPVEDAVAAVVAKEMEKLLPAMLTNFISSAAEGVTVDAVNPTPCTEQQQAFIDSLSELLFALMISKHVYEDVTYKARTIEEKLALYTKFSNKLKQEITRCVRAFSSQINNSDEGRSKLFD